MAQTPQPGPQVLTFVSSIDDSHQPYALYIPRQFDPSRPYPLVMSLHGAGSNHRLDLRRVFGKGNLPGETDLEASRVFPPLRDVPYFVASPFARGSMGYQGIAEADVYAVMDEVKRRFPIDEDRVYLTGAASGGGGALRLALTRPGVWAAVAAVSPIVPEGIGELAGNALGMPVLLVHGEQDPLVPVAVSRDWHKILLAQGARVEYTEYRGIKHNAWDSAYRGGAIFDWFDKFRRNRFPDRVRLRASAYRYGSAYWVRLNDFSPGTLASVDAEFSADNALKVTTQDVDGFTLTLEGHPRYLKAKPLAIAIDGTPLRVKAGASASFSKQGGLWKAAPAATSARDKHAGAEGPAFDVIAARHIYVYGSLGGPDEQELGKRRAQALKAAEWSAPRLRLLVSFRVMADTQVTAGDLRDSNLVLFGTKETNALIAKFASQFPIALNPGAADYGLVFVAPVGGRSALVNSGLSWWTGAENVKRPGFRFPAQPYQVLGSFEDFILFKGSLENVVAEGRFDRHWKVSSGAAAKMNASGAVPISTQPDAP
ncbi:MAG: phospholipase [Bryobacteraceae bacterium]